jgi:hypothetical protein
MYSNLVCETTRYRGTTPYIHYSKNRRLHFVMSMIQFRIKGGALK